MKLRTRLVLAFLVLLCLTIAVGGYATNRLVAVHEDAEMVATNWLPAIKSLGEMRATGNRIRAAEGDHLLASDAAELV